MAALSAPHRTRSVETVRGETRPGPGAGRKRVKTGCHPANTVVLTGVYTSMVFILGALYNVNTIGVVFNTSVFAAHHLP